MSSEESLNMEKSKAEQIGIVSVPVGSESSSSVTLNSHDEASIPQSRVQAVALQSHDYELPTWRLGIVIAWHVHLYLIST